MRNQILTRAECNALRGIAILGIVLHNYSHWLRGIVRENEYQFFQKNAEGLQYVLGNPDENLPLHLLSFFGHYGVPIFLFLSAYGLVLKYEATPELMNERARLKGAWPFIRVHFLKLFKMMFAGYVAFTLVDAILPDSHHYSVVDIISQLGMFNNLLPNPDGRIWPGPYWFFGLMLQLYIVYRLLLYRRHWGWIVGAIVVCTIIQLCCGPESETLNRVRYNFIGGMLPFGMGLLYARHVQIPPSKLYHVLTVIFVAGMIYTCSMDYLTWYLVPMLIIVFVVSLVKILPAVVNNWLEWVGSISAAMFICHPIARRVFIPISYHGNVYGGFFLYILASIALAWVFREILKKI